MKRKRWIIAMDGPAGVGKSTVGNLVAKKLGYHFINTGEMYRALTWKALEESVGVTDEKAVFNLAKSLQWRFLPSSDGGTALHTVVDGCPMTFQIREERVSRNSSAVASLPSIRQFFCRIQRRLGKNGGVVMEGRDITTHVFPDADFKIYLDASITERAKRRYRQLKASGISAERRRIRESILVRDLNDIKRKINPLACPPDAIFIDSTRMTLKQVADKILRAIKKKR